MKHIPPRDFRLDPGSSPDLPGWQTHIQRPTSATVTFGQKAPELVPADTDQYALPWDAEPAKPRHRIAGLAAKVWEVAAAPVSKSRDASAQLMERLAKLQKIVRDVHNDRFAPKDAGAPSAADIKAEQELEQLMTANKGRQEKRRTRNMREFLREIRADMREARTQTVLKREAAVPPIDADISKEFEIIAQPLLDNMVTRGFPTRDLPPGSKFSFEHAGLYGELHRILHDENEPTAAGKWRQARKLYNHIADELYPALDQPELRDIPPSKQKDAVPVMEPAHLDHAIQSALESCVYLDLKVPQKIQLLEDTLQKLQPVAVHLSPLTKDKPPERIGSMRQHPTEKNHQPKRKKHRVRNWLLGIAGASTLPLGAYAHHSIRTPPTSAASAPMTPQQPDQEKTRGPTPAERALELEKCYFGDMVTSPSAESGDLLAPLPPGGHEKRLLEGESARDANIELACPPGSYSAAIAAEQSDPTRQR